MMIVGLDADAAQLLHGVLGRLRLELARGLERGEQGHVDVDHVLAPDILAQLPDRLRNGRLSMSPTVPPTSTMTTSAPPSRLTR